jgi:TonB-linked SusC/RagA family outer membrane protein
MNYIQKILTLALILLALVGWSQNNEKSGIKITGVVYNAVSKSPVEAASVQCGNFSSTFTQADGTFNIDVQTLHDVLTVTSRNTQVKDVFLAGRSHVEIFLVAEGMASFQEKAYSAYESKKQLYVTQSVASVNGILDRSAKLSPGSGEAAFDGKVAGLDVRARNGIKGVGSDMFLRGFSSLYGTNQPLVIVDGMIYDTESYGTSMISGYRSNAFAGIDEADIENVTVVRDASAIYGAKASNGVIFIRTSHATKQATEIDFSVNGSLEFAPESVPMMDAQDYRLYLNEMMLTKGFTSDSILQMPFMNLDPSVSGYYTYNNETDWQKKVFSDSYSSHYRLKIKGGDDVALYALSIGFLDQGGTVNGSDNNRFNFRFNSDIKFSPKVTLNSNISFHYLTKNITGSGIESVYDPVYLARVKAPFLQEYVQNDAGVASPELMSYDFLNISNPISLTNNMMQKDLNYRLFGSFNFNWAVAKDLTLSNLIGMSFDKSRQSIFVPRQGVAPIEVDNGIIENQMKARVLRHFVINNDFRATYKKQFGFDHKLHAMAGVRMNVNALEEDWSGDYNSANDQLRSLGNGNYLLRQKGGTLGDWANMAIYANADYSLKNRYLFTVNVALDGSSRYGEQAAGIGLLGTRFGVYPGVAMAWVVSSESFMANVDAVEFLKIRASYGLTGNDDIGNYTAQKYYTEKNFLGYQGIVDGNLWNPALGAERTSKMNLGLDMAFAKDRISLSADVYQNKTTNLFDYISTSIFSGYNGYYGNLGGFTTSGFDVSFNSRIVNKQLVKWDLGFVLGKYTTKVDELSGESRTTQIYGASVLTEVGSPVGVFYGYKTNGVFATTDQALESNLKNRMSNEELVSFSGGDVIFEDVTPDGIIDSKDRTVIGDPTPDFVGELNTRFAVGPVSIDAALAFSYGGDVYNYMRYSLENMNSTNNQTETVINRWKYEGQETNVPRAAYGDPMQNARFSDRWIEDGSYARLKHVTITYKLPFRSNFMKFAEVYASGINLLTFTNYKGLDSEFSLNGFALSQGIDVGMVPQSRAVLFGIRLGL